MTANQYGIHQGTFRTSSVLQLYGGRSRSHATSVKCTLKQVPPFCDTVTKSSILDGGKLLDLFLHDNCLNLSEPLNLHMRYHLTSSD